MTDNYLPELIVEDDEETELPVQPEPLDDKIAYDIAYKEESEEEEEKEVKEILKVETIFKPLKIKPVVDDTLTRPSEKEEEINLNEEDFKPQQEMLGEPKKKPKQKRKMSEKQLEALARGRKTSMEKRKAKANIKKKTVDFYSDEVEDTPLKENTKIVKSVDKSEMEDAIANAIYKYDNVRKARKAEKQAAKKVKDVDKRLVQQINRAMDPSNPDYWSGCFNIT